MSTTQGTVHLLTVSQNEPLTVTRADVYKNFDQACDAFGDTCETEGYSRFNIGLYEIAVPPHTDDLERELSAESASIIKGTSSYGDVSRVAHRPAQRVENNQNHQEG